MISYLKRLWEKLKLLHSLKQIDRSLNTFQLGSYSPMREKLVLYRVKIKDKLESL